MGSLFGGAQTVPQTQFTNQNYNQTQNVAQNQTQAQGYAANPLAQQLGQQIFNMAGVVHGYGGNQPYVPLLQTAALTPEQQTGIGSLTNAGYGAGNALVPAGQQYLTQAGQGITGEDVNSFYNPMAANITANLQDIFGQQNLAARVGGTSATGGIGGDRAAVAQALLAKQQGLSAGQTYAGLWQSALQAAQQQKAQQLQAGQAALQAGFGAYGQGLQAASIPQAQQQAINQAAYQQALGNYQDPFMRLAAETGTLPVIAGLGGTGFSTASGTTQGGTTGTQTGLGNASTTYPAPSPLSQIAGLGSLALGVGSLFAGSDKRAKTDIQKYGKDKATGLPMYAYRYKGDPKTYPKVVGPMAQDIEKKYPGTTTKFARGGGIQHFQYGGGDDSGQQQQDSNYLTGFTDINTGGTDEPTAPYAEEKSTWDPKRIFSPDRLQKAQRAIAMAQRAAQQSQTARPRVAPITFPQVPWKSGPGTFQRGGRLAINLPALSRAMTQQEGGRVDAATADSWGGYKVWRPGMRWPKQQGYGFPTFAPSGRGRYPGGESGVEDIQDEDRARRLGIMDIPDQDYRFGGKVRGYDDGGFVDPLAGMDPMPEGEPEPPGLPEYEDMPDTGEDMPAVPLPQPRPPGAGQGLPFTPGGGGAAPAGGGGMSLFGRPVSPGAMALIQAGLGMLAASGQRDARGLPMSGLGAIGAGGMAGINTYQSMQNQQNKDLLAQQGMRLREQTLAQNMARQNADLALRQQAQADLERHRANLLAQRSGEDRPFTVKGLYGDRTVIKKSDGTYEEIEPVKPSRQVAPTEGVPMSQGEAGQAAGFVPADTDEQKQIFAEVMGETAAGKKTPFKSAASVDPELLKAMQMTPETFDILAIRLAKGDQAVAQAGGTRAVATMFKRALQARATQYWQDKLEAIGAGPEEAAQAANDATIEFQARKAGARTIANREGNITTALSRAEATAPVLVAASDKVNRTQYSDINKIIIAAKQRTGNEDVVKYGLALETFIRNYASAMGQGSTVLTDTSQKLIQHRLNEAYSKGQIRATVDQAILEINRELAGTQKGMDYYLGKKQGAAGFEGEGATPKRGKITGANREKAKAVGWTDEQIDAYNRGE